MQGPLRSPRARSKPAAATCSRTAMARSLGPEGSPPRSRTLPPVHLEPTIDGEGLARHVIGLVRGQIDRQATDLPGLPRALPGNPRQLLAHLCRVLDPGSGHRRVNQARCDVVDVDPVRGELE